MEIALGLGGVALVGLLVVLEPARFAPGAAGLLVVLAVAGVLALAVSRAETPFGIGNGRMPDLSGHASRCGAERVLAKRELRWRDHWTDELRAKPCEDPDPSRGCRSSILSQSPAPGTRVAPGHIVWFVPVTSCDAPAVPARP